MYLLRLKISRIPSAVTLHVSARRLSSTPGIISAPQISAYSANALSGGIIPPSFGFLTPASEAPVPAASGDSTDIMSDMMLMIIARRTAHFCPFGV